MQEQIIYIKQATQIGYTPYIVGGVLDLNYPNSKTRRGRVIDMGKTSPTIIAGSSLHVVEPHTWEIDGKQYEIRIRKLTPKECYRLMDFTDEQYDRAAECNSNTQLYKQAGNSIVVSCLREIFRELVE